MSGAKKLIGDACAYIPGQGKDGKVAYPRIGLVFQDSGDKRLSIKIDTLPLPGSGWTGWVNVFERREKPIGEGVDSFKTGPDRSPDDAPF